MAGLIQTTAELSDVNGRPKVRLDLPGPLRHGDPVALKLKLQRRSNGRTEVLEINHKFLITAVGFDGTTQPPRQLLSLDTAGKPPVWQSVKTQAPSSRVLGPTRFPRTPIR
jgi:hypothetical protein